MTVAWPLAPVVTEPDDTLPLPAPGVKLTLTPDTGLPNRSTTTTVGAGLAAPPTAPVGARLVSARSVSAVAAFTVCAAVADALVRKLASPAYVAASVFAPGVVNVRSQVPALAAAVQDVPAPSLTVTLPLGVPAPGLVTATA